MAAKLLVLLTTNNNNIIINAHTILSNNGLVRSHLISYCGNSSDGVLPTEYVTGFVERSLSHTLNVPTLTIHNFHVTAIVL